MVFILKYLPRFRLRINQSIFLHESNKKRFYTILTLQIFLGLTKITKLVKIIKMHYIVKYKNVIIISKGHHNTYTHYNIQR